MVKPHALHTAAGQVARHLGPIESAIDESFAKTAGLLALMPEARAAANLPMSVGHKAMMKVLASLNSIAQARAEIIAAHQEFADTRSELRLPETGLGSLVPCPSEAGARLVPVMAA